MGKAPKSSDSSKTPSQHGDATTLDIFAELERAGVPKDKKETGAAVTAPSTDLLFQPPETRPRRASAPAGPPPSARDSSANSKADADDSREPKKAGEAGQDEREGKSARNERNARGERSGGKSKNGSGNENDSGEKKARQNKSESSSESASRGAGGGGSNRGGAKADSDTDAASDGNDNRVNARDSDDDSGSSEEGGQRRRRRRGGRGRRGRGGSSASTSEGAEEDSGSQSSSADESDSRATEKNSDSTSKSGSKSGGRNGANNKKTSESTPADTDSKSRADDADDSEDSDDEQGSSSRRRRRRRRGGSSSRSEGSRDDEVTAPRGSTRLEAKRQRRREGRETGRRKPVITEAEFLARRESVNRTMMVRERDGRMQIAVLEDDVLVEHYVSRNEDASIAGNVYVGKVQNVLPSMEAAFVDIGKGRNAVLYAGEVNWDAAGLEANQPRRIESALSSGDHVLVQVTKDPIGHKGARLTAQISLAGRFLVFVPNGSMTGISRKLPDTERSRLKKILKDIVPGGGGVIVRTAAEGAAEEELRADIERLQKRWEKIQAAQKGIKRSAGPKLVHSEADMAIRVVRDIFNEDFEKLVVSGAEAWEQISDYIEQVAPDLTTKLSQWESEEDIFGAHRIDEQLAKGMDRKVYLPSGGSLVIDRTEAMTVVDVNTGRFTGTGGTLEETVTKNNLEAAEEVVRQLRLRDIGGIIVIDFIDMVLEQNRDLVMRRMVECLSRDRTKHQVAEVTSLGLVQMTRKRVGQGLVEAFSEKCEHCAGRGFITHDEPVEKDGPAGGRPESKSGDRKTGSDSKRNAEKSEKSEKPEKSEKSGAGSKGSGKNGRRGGSRGRKDGSDAQSGSSDSPGSKNANKSATRGGKSQADRDGNTGADASVDIDGQDQQRESNDTNDAIPTETPEEVRQALAAIAAAAVQSHERKNEESGQDDGSADSQPQETAEKASESALEKE